MDKETVEKANDLLNQINELKKYDEMSKHQNYGNTMHFEILQHYGSDISPTLQIKISRKHNARLLLEVKKIILELEEELDSI